MATPVSAKNQHRELSRSLEHLFGLRTDGYGFGKVDPASRSGGVDQEFSRARNIGATWTLSRM